MKCPDGYEYSKSLKMCVKKNGKRMKFRRYMGPSFGNREPGNKSGKANGNGNGNGNGGNGNGNGGNGGNGGGNGGGGNGG